MVVVQPEKDMNGVEMTENTIRKCEVWRKSLTRKGDGKDLTSI